MWVFNFLHKFYNHRTKLYDLPLKVAILFALPPLFGIWLGLSIGGSILVGVGYGFFTPWVSTFEAFRHDNESKKFLHCLVVNFQWSLPPIYLKLFYFLCLCVGELRMEHGEPSKEVVQ